jgi:hypothetical protein
VVRPGFEGDITVPVDLIVPAAVAPKAGRRGARLPGDHGKSAARKSDGVEGALVDYGQIDIAALDPADDRQIGVNVAGPAALLVAKAHKLGERLETPQRLLGKDAGDVYRLFDAYSVTDLATTLGHFDGGRTVASNYRTGPDVPSTTVCHPEKPRRTSGSSSARRHR